MFHSIWITWRPRATYACSVSLIHMFTKNLQSAYQPSSAFGIRCPMFLNSGSTHPGCKSKKRRVSGSQDICNLLFVCCFLRRTTCQHEISEKLSCNYACSSMYLNPQPINMRLIRVAALATVLSGSVTCFTRYPHEELDYRKTPLRA